MFIPRFDIKKLCFDPFNQKKVKNQGQEKLGQRSRSRSQDQQRFCAFIPRFDIKKIAKKIKVKVTRSTAY